MKHRQDAAGEGEQDEIKRKELLGYRKYVMDQYFWNISVLAGCKVSFMECGRM